MRCDVAWSLPPALVNIWMCKGVVRTNCVEGAHPDVPKWKARVARETKRGIGCCYLFLPVPLTSDKKVTKV